MELGRWSIVINDDESFYIAAIPQMVQPIFRQLKSDGFDVEIVKETVILKNTYGDFPVAASIKSSDKYTDKVLQSVRSACRP